MALIHSLLCLHVVAFLDTTLAMTVGIFQCPTLAPLENGNIVENKLPTHMMHYSCKFGYHLEGPPKQECVNGSWTPAEAPFCILDSSEVTCISGPVILNARVEYNNGDFTFPKVQGSVATVLCEHGYSSEDTFQTSFIIMCGLSGLWALPDGSIRLPACTRKHCPPPPEIPSALVHYDTYNLLMSEGFQVEYICSSGYILLDQSNAPRLTCRNGQWEGPVPTCVLKANCEPPAYVRNGNWNLVVKNGRDITFEQHGDTQYPKFEVGTEIEYSCNPGYKLIGHRVFECLPSQIWSSTSPECIPESENIWYCPDIGQIKNGFCKCMGESTADLQLCMPYHRGTQIQCTCLQGYKVQGVDTLTCIHSSNPNIGVWDWESPRCYKDFDPGSDIDLLPDGQNGGKSFNSGDINDGKNKVSSLVIVVTTACSVLGVLLLIMVIVVFRRKKPRAHLFQQGPAPPPYARVHDNSLDEHDRMALMAYADASRVHLPSYEESIRSLSSQGSSTPPGGSGVGPSASPTTSEYRRLPNVPPAVRAANMQHSVGGDGNNNINNNNNSNRHSTVTTSTMNRDGVSEIFGSMDTVNVSMSDASTSVTVETFDSGVSNRSMASQRAAAGSLNSSDDQIASDDAPLLDSNSQREVDVASVSSNPSRSSKDDQ